MTDQRQLDAIDIAKRWRESEDPAQLRWVIDHLIRVFDAPETGCVVGPVVHPEKHEPSPEFRQALRDLWPPGR